jgi:hypothetical protein
MANADTINNYLAVLTGGNAKSEHYLFDAKRFLPRRRGRPK